MINPGMFSSDSAEYETPQPFFDMLNRIYNFTLDPCSTHENAKCEKHYTIEDDGLAQSWQGERVFMNPPYGREIVKWVKKASEEGNKSNTLVVCLLPARTDTRWFHDYIYRKSRIEFIKGRLSFDGWGSPAPFPSMVVVFDSIFMPSKWRQV